MPLRCASPLRSVARTVADSVFSLVRRGGAQASYNAVVATAAPLMWWKQEETTGTVAADSSGNGYTGTAGTAFSTAGVSVAAVSGYAGLALGHKSTVITNTAGNAALMVGGNAAGAWTVVVWLTGSAGGLAYAFARNDDASIIVNNPAGKVQFSCAGFTGTNPLTGQVKLDLPQADTTTPHMAVYRYSNGAWSGWMDGVKVFDVASSFALPQNINAWRQGADGGGTSVYAGTVFDAQVYPRALGDAEIASMYAARNA